nr:sulfatase [Kiloniellales bacterium]
SVAVPMILAGPGIPAGVNQTPVSLNDLAATIERAVAPGPRAAVEPWEGRPLQDFVTAPEPERIVISEYHDGGSPTGLTMLRQGPWKYVHYAGGHPPQLFDLEKDPGERNDLGTDPAYAELRATLLAQLNAVLDPEAVNAQAFAEQRSKLEALGGAEKVLAMPSFNHTPLG